MTIAIPLYGERVSPHFSTAPELMVVVVQQQRPGSTMIMPLAAVSLVDRRNKLLSLGVTTLVCNGIDQATQCWLERRGLRVIANVTGEVEEVLGKLTAISSLTGR
ncbi:NifB/NifX family molybdenum-iron cluster-binding protein [Desulfoferrobacter suflitae]|uniref:NifB/NifX family molybdenum-iron cluster-binding protein n=1 Tax=Desulfoferrobacter suflitae TaxID=2865782 RepID=UPI00216446FF|nr:NifB/NifX family molybdenum-iron cluster-binding protein [Desulfoferrobacter suflitae]MCK8603716.1 NifB/NifX family molybdenum-iron cluster-binding protein [Desulfoferrobacter suflitae]